MNLRRWIVQDKEFVAVNGPIGRGSSRARHGYRAFETDEDSLIAVKAALKKLTVHQLLVSKRFRQTLSYAGAKRTLHFLNETLITWGHAAIELLAQRLMGPLGSPLLIQLVAFRTIGQKKHCSGEPTKGRVSNGAKVGPSCFPQKPETSTRRAAFPVRLTPPPTSGG